MDFIGLYLLIPFFIFAGIMYLLRYRKKKGLKQWRKDMGDYYMAYLLLAGALLLVGGTIYKLVEIYWL